MIDHCCPILGETHVSSDFLPKRLVILSHMLLIGMNPSIHHESKKHLGWPSMFWKENSLRNVIKIHVCTYVRNHYRFTNPENPIFFFWCVWKWGIHPFPSISSYFHGGLCHLGGPTSSASRTSEASALSEIVGEAKTLRLKNVGNVPFIVELCWIYS